ncbi:MAG: SDR family NAD(P)-dependent oxidoreductase [Alphaproteobacteria bacterium]
MHVIITGANRGIGLELAKIYEAQGCQVTKTSRKAMPGYATLDVNDPASHEAFAASLDGAPVDLYIANAGINIRNDESVDTGYAADEWAQTFQTNVTGVFLGIQSMLPALRAAPAPKIAIISSQLASSTNSGTGMLTYRASKAAVLNLGRNLAKELAPEGLPVGIFHPGWVVTDMGGAGADITVDVSASGLVGRIDALSMANTGIYEDYKGDALPY